MLATGRWRPQPIKYRVRERRPITERLQSISLKSHLRETYLQYGLAEQLFVDVISLVQ